MKKFFTFFIIVGSFFLLGGIFVKNKLFPYKIFQNLKYKYKDIQNFDLEEQYKDKYSDWENNDNDYKLIRVTKYSKGINIYSDRNYYNHEGHKFLNDYFLIQIPRHNDKIKEFKVKFNSQTEVIRAQCLRNDNSAYKDWEKTVKKIAVIGISCVHTKIIKKEFKKGVYKFNLGGPITSDPIFFKSKKIQIKNFYLR